MSSAKPGEKRGVADKRDYTENDKEHAKDDAYPEVELDERTDEVKAEEKN
jgi:hypothetical protein